ncbi:MAG TPA: DHH family phosphoesterase [Coprothermobacter proteolyticus]|nr:DHH family phosphoesterase [Coprothermobacter proteolyticus]
MKMDSKKILKEITKSRKGIKIVTHERPDVDALGSVAGMGWILHSMPMPFFTCVETWLSFHPDLRPPSSASASDMQLVLDVSDPNRTYGFDIGLHTVVIDHHPVEEMRFLSVVDPDCCATSALLSELFFDYLDERSSTCLLAGVLADTGVLSYSNVDERALRDALRLIQRGAKWEIAYGEATKICGMEQAKHIAQLLRKVYEYKPGVFVLTVPKEDRIKYGFTDADCSSVLSIMQWIGKGCLFISARENNNQAQITNISFRSRYPFEAIKYAKALGGGGHRMAAAAKVSMGLGEVMEEVLALVDTDVAAFTQECNEPPQLSELDLQLSQAYAESELLSVNVTEGLLEAMTQLISKGGNAERAAMKVRENITLESLHELAEWINSSEDVSNPTTLVQRIFARQVDLSCQS